MFLNAASSTQPQQHNTAQVVPELEPNSSDEQTFPPVTNPSPMGNKGFDFLFSPFGNVGKFDLPPTDFQATPSSGPSGLMTPNTTLLLSLLQSGTPQTANTQASPFVLAASVGSTDPVLSRPDVPFAVSTTATAGSGSGSTPSLFASSLAPVTSATSSLASLMAAPLRGPIPAHSHQQLLAAQASAQAIPTPTTTTATSAVAPAAAAAAAVPAAHRYMPATTSASSSATSVTALASPASSATTLTRQRQAAAKRDAATDDEDVLDLDEEEDEDEEDGERADEDNGSDSEGSFSLRQQQQHGRKGRKRKATQPAAGSASTFEELTDDQIAFMDFKELMRLMLAAGLSRQDIAETKARRRRLKNRQSARLCSNKKRELCNELSSKNQQLHDTIDRLQREVDRLKKENALLKQMR